MKHVLLCFLVWTSAALHGQSILDSTTFTLGGFVIYDHDGPGFMSVNLLNAQFQVNYHDSLGAIYQTQQIPVNLPTTETMFIGLRFFKNSSKCLLMASHRLDPGSSYVTNSPHSYQFTVLDFQSKQLVLTKIDTLTNVSLNAVTHKSDLIYLVSVNRAYNNVSEVLDFYSFDLTGQRTYLNTISESSPYYMLEDAMIESDGDRMVLLTRIYDGLYRTETYNEYFSLVTTEEAQTNSLNFYSLMLHQRLNADSVLIIRQHEDWLTRNFQWEFEWWKSPNALIRQKYMNTDTYTNQLDYGNTYRSGYSEAILDTLHRQILVYAYESSSSQTSEYARRIYYYDYDFNVLCIDSMLLPDWASRYQLMTLDGQSYFSYYNQTSTAFHPIHCGSTQQEAPQDTSSVAEALVIYPNPSNGLFYVANASHLPTLLRIFSLQGTLLYEDYSSEELIVLDVYALTNGTYSLQLQTPIQTQTQTIYIE